MVSFSYPATASLPSREVRAALILTSVIGVTLNIVMAALGRAKVEGALGITFLACSGLLAIPQLTNPNKDRPVITMMVDGAFCFALFLVYLLVLILSNNVRHNMFYAYANLACLVSSIIHGYAFSTQAYHLFQTTFRSGAAFCPHCAHRPADYKPVMVQDHEIRGNTEGSPLLDGADEDSPALYRDSQETGTTAV